VLAVPGRGALEVIGADLVRLAAMSADDGAVARKRAQLAVEVALADGAAIRWLHARGLVDAARARQRRALPIVRTGGFADAAGARVGRAHGSGAIRHWRAWIFRIRGQQVATQRVVRNRAADRRRAGLRAGEVADLGERSAAHLRVAVADLVRAVALL